MLPVFKHMYFTFSRNNSVLPNCALKELQMLFSNMLLQPSDTFSHYRFICQGILELFFFFFFPLLFFVLYPLDKSVQVNIEYPHLNVSFRGKTFIHELHVNYYIKQFNCNMTQERSSDLNKPHRH